MTEDRPGGPGEAHHLGVDIGGTKVALRVEAGTRRVAETVFPWQPRPGADRDLAQLAEHVGELRDRLGVPFRAVGLAVPATVGPDGRITAWPSRPEWTGTDLGAALRTLFPEAAVAWADDGDLGALAEAEAADCADLLYVGVGTGVGGGLVLGGELCPGTGRGSFEIGHTVVELDGPRCVCGRHGCLQAIASGPATLRHAARLRGSDVTFDALRQGWCDGRPWAVDALRRTARALAAAAVSVQELVHPRLLLIGGGFANGMPGLDGLVSARLAELARPGQPPLEVGPATLGPLSSLRGAVALARLTRP
ncbi:ROK family protein [Streptomyces longispororuber]|uniref:ROK family protein n=1 Tax=Streptomyces longispororuber TaxID=68230 RepID=UPI00210DC8B7|nr:ROK family protein [Streptomyces longispororuber]MCQ4212407.1 ROK family protein [Streptomyces longispororuber]